MFGEDVQQLVQGVKMSKQDSLKMILIVIIALIVFGSSCISEEDILQGSDEAAYVTIVYGESDDFAEEISFIICTVFKADGIATGYALYPPNIDPSTMTWKLNKFKSILTVQYESGSIEEYRVLDTGLELVSTEENTLFSGELFSYVGSLENAVDFAEDTIENTYRGGVEENSIHYSDAQPLYNGMRILGYSPRVNIQDTNGEVGFLLGYRGCWFLNEEDLEDNIKRIVYSFAAIGHVSANTDWRSNSAYVLFEDYVFVLNTSDCRYISEHYNYPLSIAGGQDYSQYLIALGLRSDDTILAEAKTIQEFTDYYLENVSSSQLYQRGDYWERALGLSSELVIEAGYYQMSINYGQRQGNHYWQNSLREWEDVSGSILTAIEAYDVLTREYEHNIVSIIAIQWYSWMPMSGYPQTSYKVLDGALEYILDNCRSDQRGYTIN